jgi:terminase small subunit-like protein
MAGRPSTYTEDVANTILERLSAGEPLAQICRDEGMPAVRTVSDWKASHPVFAEAFGIARDEGFDAIALDALGIADDGRRDYTEQDDGHGGTRVVADHDHIQRSKLRVETRLKLLAKWDPKRYGDRTVLAGDPDAPLAALSDETLDARIIAGVQRLKAAMPELDADPAG